MSAAERINQQGHATATSNVESIYVASQWQLMWRKFRKHRLAVVSGLILILIYSVGLFAEFIANNDPSQNNPSLVHAPPQLLHFVGPDGFSFRPFVYGYKTTRDPDTLRRLYQPDTTKIYYLKFLTRGEKYKLFGLWETGIHLFGANGTRIYLAGTDRLGRCLFSRILYGSKVSTTIGLVGVFLSLTLGVIIGGFSGYRGGLFDAVTQRLIEFLRSIPTIPLWMALGAALPSSWSPLKVYFGITVILSLIGWTGLARVVRSKFLSIREEDYVLAARLAGAKESRIIFRHMVPSFLSHIIAAVTLSIPSMILGETSLSFLGLGLRPPIISWGVLLQEAQNVRTIVLTPWLLLPAIPVIITVLSFNFLGDGLRDAADPYGR